MRRVFANGPGDQGSISGWVIPKTQKMVLVLYSPVPYHNDTIIKTDAVINDAGRKTSLAIFTSDFICKIWKVVWGFTVRGSWRSNITAIFWPPNLWLSALCLSRSPELLNRRPRAHSAEWWLSLLHLIRIFSGSQLIRASSPFGPVWLSLPHLLSNCIQLYCLQLNWLELCWVV